MSDQPPLPPDPEDATQDLSKQPTESDLPKPPTAQDPSIAAPPPPPPSSTVPPPPPPPSSAVPPPPPPPPSSAVPPPAYDAAPPPPPPPPPPGAGAYPPYGDGAPAPAARFSAVDALGYGWKGFTNNLGPILLILLVLWAINAVVFFLSRWAADSSVLSLVFSLVAVVISWIITLGVIRAALAIVDGRRPEISELLSAEGLLPFIVASILFGIIVSVGTLLCIIPGIIAAFLLYFFAYAIVDGKTSSPIDALKISYGVTSKNVGDLLVFIILAFLLNLAGALLCGIGLIITWPVTAIAAAYAWRRFTQGRVAPQP